MLDRFGTQHPQPGSTHWYGQLGKHQLKWENHTLFVTYTLFVAGQSDRPFDPTAFDLFPTDWLDKASGTRISSALIRIETATTDDAINTAAERWFVPESLALSAVLDAGPHVGCDQGNAVRQDRITAP